MGAHRQGAKRPTSAPPPASRPRALLPRLPPGAGPPLRAFVAAHMLPLTGGSLEPFLAHESEALAEAVTHAQRAGRARDLASAYAASPAAAAAAGLAAAAAPGAAAGGLGAAMAGELRSRRATATPWCARGPRASRREAPRAPRAAPPPARLLGDLARGPALFRSGQTGPAALHSLPPARRTPRSPRRPPPAPPP
jgi:hypothetical protein